MAPNLAYHGSSGDYFASHADNSAYNAYLDRPAMLRLVGDVSGQRILDAGCGAGHQTAALVDRGASVLGLEGSATLVEHARTRLGHRAEIRQHDLDTPLGTVPDASFDGVLCALVLHHLRERSHFLSEVFRVLRPGGWFALSTTHPTWDWRQHGGSYFPQDWVDLPAGDRRYSIHYQRMSLETILNELLAAGFDLEEVAEERPVEALRDVKPSAYDDLSHKPSFLALRLRRRSNPTP